MNIFEPIKEVIIPIIESEKRNNNLEKSCGIISSCYPPSEIYPDGHKVEYQFPIKPNEVKFYINQTWQN
jgi:hypothetical protein